MKLRSEGGIKALLGTVRCGHPDVLSQVARGIANFAKCESRASSQGKHLFQINIYIGYLSVEATWHVDACFIIIILGLLGKWVGF